MKPLLICFQGSERNTHRSFLGAKISSRYRKEPANHALQFYALVIPFQPSWSVSRLMKFPQENITSLVLGGALLSAHPDRVQGITAIDFRHRDLYSGNVPRAKKHGRECPLLAD